MPRKISTHRAVNILNFLSELFPVQLNRYLLRFSFVGSISLTSVNTNIPWHCGVVPGGFFSQVRTGFPPSLAIHIDLFGGREGSIVGNLNFPNSNHWVKTFTFIKFSLPVNASLWGKPWSSRASSCGERDSLHHSSINWKKNNVENKDLFRGCSQWQKGGFETEPREDVQVWNLGQHREFLAIQWVKKVAWCLQMTMLGFTLRNLKTLPFLFWFHPGLYLLSTLVCFLPLPGQSHSTVTRYLSGNESPTPCTTSSLLNRMTEGPLNVLFSVWNVLYPIYARLTPSLPSSLSSNVVLSNL